MIMQTTISSLIGSGSAIAVASVGLVLGQLDEEEQSSSQSAFEPTIPQRQPSSEHHRFHSGLNSHRVPSNSALSSISFHTSDGPIDTGNRITANTYNHLTLPSLSKRPSVASTCATSHSFHTARSFIGTEEPATSQNLPSRQLPTTARSASRSRRLFTPTQSSEASLSIEEDSTSSLPDSNASIPKPPNSTSWIRRLSIRPRSRNTSSSCSTYAETPAISVSLPSSRPSSTQYSDSIVASSLPPNKLVKRPAVPETNHTATEKPSLLSRTLSKSRLPSLRRPSTSHQRHQSQTPTPLHSSHSSQQLQRPISPQQKHPAAKFSFEIPISRSPVLWEEEAEHVVAAKGHVAQKYLSPIQLRWESFIHKNLLHRNSRRSNRKQKHLIDDTTELPNSNRFTAIRSSPTSTSLSHFWHSSIATPETTIEPSHTDIPGATATDRRSRLQPVLITPSMVHPPDASLSPPGLSSLPSIRKLSKRRPQSAAATFESPYPRTVSPSTTTNPKPFHSSRQLMRPVTQPTPETRNVFPTHATPSTFASRPRRIIRSASSAAFSSRRTRSTNDRDASQLPEPNQPIAPLEGRRSFSAPLVVHPSTSTSTTNDTVRVDQQDRKFRAQAYTDPMLPASPEIIAESCLDKRTARSIERATHLGATPLRYPYRHSSSSPRRTFSTGNGDRYDSGRLRVRKRENLSSPIARSLSHRAVSATDAMTDSGTWPCIHAQIQASSHDRYPVTPVKVSGGSTSSSIVRCLSQGDRFVSVGIDQDGMLATDGYETDMQSTSMFDSIRTGASTNARTIDTPLESLFDESTCCLQGHTKHNCNCASGESPLFSQNRMNGNRISSPSSRPLDLSELQKLTEKSLNRKSSGYNHIEKSNSTIQISDSASSSRNISPYFAYGLAPRKSDIDEFHLVNEGDLDEREFLWNDPAGPHHLLTPLSPPGVYKSTGVAQSNQNPKPTLPALTTTSDGYWQDEKLNSGHPRSSIFEWSESSAVEREFEGISPRPRTVQGRKETDSRSSRWNAQRRGPTAAHVRSQSVPVAQDSVEGTSVLTPKFGTWGLGSKMASEDWGDDFEFEDELDELDESEPHLAFSVLVPAAIQASQPSVRAHSDQIRELSLLVNDLKRLCRHGRELNLEGKANGHLWKEAESIIALASPDDEATDENDDDDDDDEDEDGRGANVQQAIDAESASASNIPVVDLDHVDGSYDRPLTRFSSHVIDDQQSFAFSDFSDYDYSSPVSKTAVVRERPSPQRPSVFGTDDFIFGNHRSLRNPQSLPSLPKNQDSANNSYDPPKSPQSWIEHCGVNVTKLVRSAYVTRSSSDLDSSLDRDQSTNHLSPEDAQTNVHLVPGQQRPSLPPLSSSWAEKDGKLHFDTTSLKALVKRASDLRDALSESVGRVDAAAPGSPVKLISKRKSDQQLEPNTSSDENSSGRSRGSPAFVQVFQR